MERVQLVYSLAIALEVEEVFWIGEPVVPVLFTLWRPDIEVCGAISPSSSGDSLLMVSGKRDISSSLSSSRVPNLVK